MSHMVDDHHKDIAAFTKESKTGTDAEVKAFATQSLPVLQSHLQMAEQVNASVGGKAAGADMHGEKGAKNQ